MRRGLGFFVSQQARALCRREQSEMLARKLAGLISEAKEANLDESEVREMFEKLLLSPETGADATQEETHE